MCCVLCNGHTLSVTAKQARMSRKAPKTMGEGNTREPLGLSQLFVRFVKYTHTILSSDFKMGFPYSYGV